MQWFIYYLVMILLHSLLDLLPKDFENWSALGNVAFRDAVAPYFDLQCIVNVFCWWRGPHADLVLMCMACCDLLTIHGEFQSIVYCSIDQTPWYSDTTVSCLLSESSDAFGWTVLILWDMLQHASVGNESVPKIIVNDTNFFLKLQSAFW